MSGFACGPLVRGAVLVSALCGVFWVYLQADQIRELATPERARRQGRPIPVRTAKVEETRVDDVIGATAVTVPSEVAVIQVSPTRDREYKVNDPVSDATLKAVHVREGDRVQRSQLLFELEDASHLRVVKHRELALALAEGQLEHHREDVLHRERVYATSRRLWERGVGDLTQLDIAQAGYAYSRAQLAAAEQVAETARADLEVARLDLERVQVKSPIEGFATAVDGVPGMTVGLKTVLTRVVRLDPIHVRLELPQERIDDVSVGQEAEVVLDSLPQETFRGTVARIAPEVNPELRMLPVVVELSNPDERIKAGISGFVRLRKFRTATLVPTTAVIRGEGKAMVFGVAEGRARIREIRTGPPLRSGFTEVRGGLSPGDDVVVFHNFYRHAGNLTERLGYLQDNDPVDVDWRKWAGRE